ncbi:MAG TPA: hypothetical protein VMJ65_07440 [Solirubrobacteraceae bacterium]|nr:hypothetical protein [Solirubrobacteraceae bacterium]
MYTFTVPYAAIQLTLYYFDLEAQSAAETEDTIGPADRSPSAPSVV